MKILRFRSSSSSASGWPANHRQSVGCMYFQERLARTVCHCEALDGRSEQLGQAATAAPMTSGSGSPHGSQSGWSRSRNMRKCKETPDEGGGREAIMPRRRSFGQLLTRFSLAGDHGGFSCGIAQENSNEDLIQIAQCRSDLYAIAYRLQSGKLETGSAAWKTHSCKAGQGRSVSEI